MTDIEWRDVKIKIGDLKLWQDNPKRMKKRDAKILLESWEKLGQFQTIAVSPSLDVYDGHQRIIALLSAYGKDYEVSARMSNRLLTDEERRALVLASRQIGSWDWDKLSAWDIQELQNWGFDEEMLDSLREDVSAISALLESENQSDEEIDNETIAEAKKSQKK